MQDIPKYYSAINKNEHERDKSTSGAIFPLLAKQIIKENGVVCGVAYDDNMVVKHMIATTEEEIEKFKGSKYVYSNIGGIFLEIKKILKNGRKVLFTGNPCQIVALKKYLKEEDTKNLYLMDIICHSTSKPLIFKKYIQYLEDKYHKKVININFRDKIEGGWHNSKPKVYFEDGSSIVDTVFYYAFSSGAISREECFKCTYYSIDRNSDITIGDFWGVDKFLPDMDDNKGTSVVIVSTKKGEELFEKIKNDIKFKEIEKEKVLKYNHNKTTVKHKKYEKIQKKVNDDDFFEYLRKAIKLNIFERLHRRINIILKLK